MLAGPDNLSEDTKAQTNAAVPTSSRALARLSATAYHIDLPA